MKSFITSHKARKNLNYGDPGRLVPCSYKIFNGCAPLQIDWQILEVSILELQEFTATCIIVN